MQVRLTRFLAILCSCLLYSFVVSGCQPSKSKAIESKSSSRENATDQTQVRKETVIPGVAEDSVRFATFNVSFYRLSAGELARELSVPGSSQPGKIAEIVQRVRPDVLLLNEFDFDPSGKSIDDFQKNYLGVSQNGQPAIRYQYKFSAPVNTGVDSGFDLNADGQKGDAADAYGFGAFPGQYGMVVLSKYPIEVEAVRTFQNFLWKDMPSALWPIDPKTNQPYYSEDVRSIFRLSSKSHWDVPIQWNDQTIHFLVSHPTPPVFDGPEDRNGCRNHDEIRFWIDYVAGAEYFYDDRGNRGALAKDSKFVIAGDQNADPVDGDCRDRPGKKLIESEFVNATTTPGSDGATQASQKLGEANLKQLGDSKLDTAEFNPTVGNLRVDYCLPSRNLEIAAAGVFWPASDSAQAELISASDHRMVWVDVK